MRPPIVRGRRQEQLVLEAGGEVANGPGQLRVDGVLRAAGRRRIVRLVQDEQGAPLKLPEPVSQRTGVGLVSNEGLGDDEAAVGRPRVNAVAPFLPLGGHVIAACVERLWSTFGGSMPATSSVGGLGRWELGHTEQLKDNRVQDVAIIPDARKEGWDRAYAVARSCAAAGLRVRMVFLPDGMANVCAYFDADREKRVLENLILAAPSATGPSLAPTRDPDAVPMRWLWPGRISLGGITVLDSVFDREKRLLAFDLAARCLASRRAVRCPTARQNRRRQATLSC